MELFWLKSVAEEWLGRVRQNRMPHAVLLLGPAGTGKRALAAWIARERLEIAPTGRGPEYPFVPPVHADLHWIGPPEDRQTIGIEQIRALADEFNLTSYEGGSKVAVVDPANAMTVNAANGLLKTLEEPPGDALLILIADRAGRLPATIFSRCQRINISRPAEPDSLQWLDRIEPASNWRQALDAAAGAPLAAIAARARLADTETMAREFSDVAERRAAPLAVAARWAKYEPDFVLDWLCGQIQQTIYRLAGKPSKLAAPSISDSVLRHIDRRNLFCYLDIINRLRGQTAGSFNLQLTLDSLLIDWSQGLAGVQESGTMEAAKLSFICR